MKTILIVLVLIAAGVGGYIFFTQPDEIPNIMLKSSDGRQVDLSTMHSGKAELLMIFLLPNCPISKFSMELVTQHYPRYSATIAFAGLFFGDRPPPPSSRPPSSSPSRFTASATPPIPMRSTN